MGSLSVGQSGIFRGWKDIARYTGMSVRTLQRYEHNYGLPVRRPSSRPRGSVVATKIELEHWIKAKPLSRPRMPEAYLAAFQKSIAEQRRLREEMKEARQRVHTTLERLRAQLQE